MSITAKSSKAYSTKVENSSVELIAKSRHLKATPRLSAKYVNLQTYTGSHRSSQQPPTSNAATLNKPSSESKKADVDSDDGYNSSEFEEEKGSKSVEPQSERLLSAISRFQKSKTRKSTAVSTDLEAGTVVAGFRAPSSQDVAVSSTTAFTRPSKPQNQYAKRMAYYDKVRDLSLSAKGPESKLNHGKEKGESIRAKQLLYDEKVRKMNWHPLPPVPPALVDNGDDTYNKRSVDPMNDVYFAKSFGIPDESELERKQSEFDYEEPTALHLPAKRLLESKSSPQRYYMRTSDDYEEEESSSPRQLQSQRLSPPPSYEETIQQSKVYPATSADERETEPRVFFPAARKAIPSPLIAPPVAHHKKVKSDRNKGSSNKIVTRSVSRSRKQQQQQDGAALPLNESTQTSLSFPKQQQQAQTTTTRYEDEAIQVDQPANELEEHDEDVNTLIELPEIRLSLSERLGHYFESKASSRDVSFTSTSIAPNNNSGGYRIINAAARRALQQAETFGNRMSSNEPLMAFPDITKYIPNVPATTEVESTTGKSLTDIIYRGQIHAPYPRYDSSDDDQPPDDYHFQDDDDRGPEYGVVNTIMKKMAVEKQKTKDAKLRLEQQQNLLRQQQEQEAKEHQFLSSYSSPERKSHTSGSNSVDIEAIKQQIKREIEEESRDIIATQDAWVKAIERSYHPSVIQQPQSRAQEAPKESTALKLRMQMMAELEKQDRLFQYTLELQDLTTHQQPPIIIANNSNNNANKQLEETTRELLRNADRNMQSTEATIEESERLLTLYQKLQESQVAMATQQAYQRNMELYQNLAMLPLLDREQQQQQRQAQQPQPVQVQAQAPSSPAYSNHSAHRTPYVVQEALNIQTQTSPERRSVSTSIMAFGSPLSTRSSPQRRQPQAQQSLAQTAPHATEAIGKLRLQELETRHTERMAWLDHVMRLHLTTTTEAADERVRMEELHRAELERLYDSLTHSVARQPKSALAANLVGNSRLSKAQSFGVDELLPSPSPAVSSVSIQQRSLPALPSSSSSSPVHREKITLSSEKAQLQQLQQLVRQSPVRDRYTPRQDEEEEEQEAINILPRSKLTSSVDISPLNSGSYSTSIDKEREKYSPAAAISRSWLHPSTTTATSKQEENDEEEEERKERSELQAMAQKIMNDRSSVEDTFSSDEDEDKGIVEQKSQDEEEERSAAFEIEESDHEEDEYLEDTFIKSAANQSQSIIAPAAPKQQQQHVEDSYYGGYSEDFHHHSQQQQQRFEQGEASYSYSFTAPSTSAAADEIEEEEFHPCHRAKQQQLAPAPLYDEDEDEVPEEVHEASLAMSVPDETGLDISVQSNKQHSLTLSIAEDSESKSKSQGLMAISSTVEEEEVDDEYEQDETFEEDKGVEETYGTASFEVSNAAAPRSKHVDEEETDDYEEDFDQSKPNIPALTSSAVSTTKPALPSPQKKQESDNDEEESVPEEDIPEEEEEADGSDDELNYSDAQLAPTPAAVTVPALPVHKEGALDETEEEYEEEGFETAEGSSQSRQSTSRSLAMPPPAATIAIATASPQEEEEDGYDDDYDEFEQQAQTIIAPGIAKDEPKAVKPQVEDEEIEEEVSEEIVDTESEGEDDDDEDSLSPSKPTTNDSKPPFSPRADKSDLHSSSSQHSSPAVRRLSLEDRDRSDSLELGLNDLPTDPSQLLYDRLQKASTVSTNDSNMIFDYDQQKWIGGDDVSLGGFEESESESSSPAKQKISLEDGLIIEEDGITMSVKTIDGHHAKEMSDYFPVRSFAALTPAATAGDVGGKQHIVVRDIDDLLDNLSIPSDDDEDDDVKKEQAVNEYDDHSSSEFKDSFSDPPGDAIETQQVEQLAELPQQSEQLEVTDAEQIGDLIMARLVAEAVEVVTRSLSSSTPSSLSDHDRPPVEEDVEPVALVEDEEDIDLMLQSSTMTYDYIAKIEAVLQLLDVVAISSLLQSKQQGAISKVDIGLDASSTVDQDNQPDWGYEVYSDRVLELISSLQQQSSSSHDHDSSKQRVIDRLDIASSLFLTNSNRDHAKHGEMIRSYLRHKLLTEASNNNSSAESNEVWSNLDHETLAVVIDQADQTLNAQIELMTNQFLAHAQDEANNNQR